MLLALGGRKNERKLRLFAVACSRRTSHLWKSPHYAQAVDVAERLADGQAVNAQRRNAWKSVIGAPYFCASVAGALTNATLVAANRAAEYAANTLGEAEKSAQVALLKDLFGNPFCPVSVNPAWLTSTVISLAEGIYAERAFDRLPILADALQDAGCANSDVLEHSRSEGPHVRGCWV